MSAHEYDSHDADKLASGGCLEDCVEEGQSTKDEYFSGEGSFGEI